MNGKQFGIVLIGVVMVIATVGAAALVASPPNDTDKVRVVTSFYPLAYLAQSIGGERIEVSTLIPPNIEVHSWQPSASDILEVDSADIFVYNGAGLEPWIEEELLPAIDTVSKIVLDTTSGFESEGDHLDDGHDHGLEDPHTWISPNLARLQAEAIYSALVEVDPSNATFYDQKWVYLSSLLQGLDDMYSETLESREFNTIFVTHSAYGRLADRYGFEQEGVIGISADEQPSPIAIANLVDRMVSEGIYTIFLDPVFSDDYAKMLSSEVEKITGLNVEVLELYIMTGPIGDKDYIDQMELNLQNLALGLGC